MHDDPVQFRVCSVVSLTPEVIERTGYSRSMTVIEATGSDTNPSASMVDTSWKLVGEDEPVGVSYTGDPAFMLRIAVVWQQQPTLDALNLIEVPFVAAHVTHAILRYIPAAEVTVLAEKASKRKPGDPGHSLLVGLLTEHIQQVIRAAGDPPSTPEQADLDARGVVSLDRALAGVVAKIGKTGAAIAKKILAARPAAPWSRWRREGGGTASTIGALRSLASVVWLDVVKPRLDDEKRRHPRGLIRPVYTSQVLMSHIRPNIRETPDGQRLLPGLVEGGLDCRIIPQADARLFGRAMAGLYKFNTLTGHRVLRWEIETGHRQFLDGLTRPGVDFRKIEVEGGYSEIAKLIGLHSNQDVSAIREIIAAQDATIFNFPWAHMGAGHSGRLLTLGEIGATRLRRARVQLFLGPMLLPGYASDIKAPSVSAASRKLVPVTDLPPLIGRPNEHGPQVSLSMMLVLYLRDRAADLHKEGMVQLRPIDLQGMARQVGLTDDPGFLADLWRRWQGEDVRGSDPSVPAFVKVDGENFTLSDHHAAARQAIVDAGAQEAAGRIRGLKSQELRAKKQAITLKRGR